MATIYLISWACALAWPALVGFALYAWRRRRWRPGRPAWAAFGFVTLFWSLGCWAFLIEPELLVVRRIEVVSQTWTGPPVRVALLADQHMGTPHSSVARIRQVVASLNAEQPDMVALLGDAVSGHQPPAARKPAEVAAFNQSLEALAGLKAKFGVFAVLGNHDVWYDADDIAKRLTAAGVHVLRNASAHVDQDGVSFYVAGLNDFAEPRAQWPSYTQALEHVPDAVPVIVLSHRPDKFAAAPARVALTLAAHTHCGQIVLPFIPRILPGVAAEERRWACGLYEDHGRRLYVTGGIGVTMLPARFRQPPEIVVITLRPVPPPLAPAPLSPPPS